jgi:hypothetical protein
MTQFDDTLTRLFAEARGTPPAEDFLRNVATRMSHARRRRSIRRLASALATAGFAVALTPWAAAGSLALANHLAACLPAIGNALTSPVAWLCSLPVAAWGLRRVRRLS